MSLIAQMLKLGASKVRLVAKIAGGAQMFAMNTNNDTLRVGERNVAAVKMKLSELNIRLLSEDCRLIMDVQLNFIQRRENM